MRQSWFAREAISTRLVAGVAPTTILGRGLAAVFCFATIFGAVVTLCPAVAAAKPQKHPPQNIVAAVALAQVLAGPKESWPDRSGEGLAFSGADVRAVLDPVRFPDPHPGLEPFAFARACDNLIPLDYAVTWDSNGDGLLVVEYRGATGAGVCGMRVEVVREYKDIQAPVRGVVLFSGGDLISNGGGTNPKIQIEVPPPTAVATNVRVAGTIEDPTVTEFGIVQITGSTAGTIDDCITPDYVAFMKSWAQATGRYFTSEASAEASPVDADMAPQGGLSGLCVIELPPGQSVSMSLTSVLNSQAKPGRFFLLCSGGGSVDLSVGGNSDYYGIVYVSGQISETAGAGTVHGAWFATGSVDMRKTLHLVYNDNCLVFPQIRETIGVVPVAPTRVRLE